MNRFQTLLPTASNSRPYAEVCQEFDGVKFNFTKADKQEILFCFQQGRPALDHSEYHAAAAVQDSPTAGPCTTPGAWHRSPTLQIST